MTPENEIPIACNPNAIPANERDQWVATGTKIYAAVLEVRELPDGYQLRLPADTATLLELATYISNERLCCAFLRFTVVVDPAGGPIWLILGGGAGVKEYLRSVFVTSELLDEPVARAAGLR